MILNYRFQIQIIRMLSFFLFSIAFAAPPNIEKISVSEMYKIMYEPYELNASTPSTQLKIQYLQMNVFKKLKGILLLFSEIMVIQHLAQDINFIMLQAHLKKSLNLQQQLN